jgi:hypothetical protein
MNLAFTYPSTVKKHSRFIYSPENDYANYDSYMETTEMSYREQHNHLFSQQTIGSLKNATNKLEQGSLWSGDGDGYGGDHGGDHSGDEPVIAIKRRFHRSMFRNYVDLSMVQHIPSSNNVVEKMEIKDVIQMVDAEKRNFIEKIKERVETKHVRNKYMSMMDLMLLPKSQCSSCTGK